MKNESEFKRNPVDHTARTDASDVKSERDYMLMSSPVRLLLAVFLPAVAGFSAVVVPVPAPALVVPARRPAPFARPHETAVAGSRVPSAPAMLFGRNELPVPALRSSLFALGWFSWWSQAILSTVSAVTFLFANSITRCESGALKTTTPNPTAR